MPSQPDVWLFYSNKTNDQHEALNFECTSRGWRLVKNARRQTRLSSGRPIQSVKPEVATDLYRRIHTRLVAVLETNGTFVPTTPAPRLVSRDYVSLNEFVRYKAFYFRVPKAEGMDWFPEFLNNFTAWSNSIACENPNDPRCLPFHVFKAPMNVYDLSVKEDRDRFQRDFGIQGQNARKDDSGLTWASGAYHGRDILNVSGYELPRGFHWDVSATGSRKRISTTQEIWEIASRGYANISPDARIRAGRMSKRLKLR